LVLSLPNHADLVFSRYFRCAGIPFAKYWTRQEPKNITGLAIGECFLTNLQQRHDTDNSMTDGCGQHPVWMDLQFMQGPHTIHQYRRSTQGECFDPVLYQYPRALEQLYQSYNNVTVVHVIQDPYEWYTTLPKDYHRHWSEWCNPTHNNTFPNVDTQQGYVQFYNMYQERLRTFVQGHPSWRYVEVDIRNRPETIATNLSKQLGIPAPCWTRSYDTTATATNTRIQDFGTTENDHGGDSTARKSSERLFPNNLRFPILITALPKSGTTTIHKYFRCGLGRWTAAHQQVLNLTSGKTTTIGECIKENLDKERPILHQCGNARVFSDIGVFHRNDTLCYYPTLHDNGLDEFVKSYPYGTILHVRRNVTAWYHSAKKWDNLLARWSNSNPFCQDVFPPLDSNQSVWERWYENYNQRIESFATNHSTLTYLDIPLEDSTASAVLKEAFGFRPDCWGHANQFASIQRPID
jgi:hypothetical protein